MSVFENIAYLSQGNERQRAAYRVLTQHRVLEKLAPFTPLLVGTIPLAIDVPGSDLDIICCWARKADFETALLTHFGAEPGFSLKHTVVKDRESIVANCTLGDFAVEFFGQGRPSREQDAYRHMLVEYKLLQQHGEAFRQRVVALKQAGVKTEPAFARLLHLPGDPYEALLQL